MANNNINFGIRYTVDKASLNEIKSSLQSLQKLTTSDLMNLNKSMDLPSAKAQLAQIKQTAKEVGDALDRSFNTNLGTLNISKFNQELKSLDINRIYNDFNSAGAAGQSAFRNITSQILTTNMQLKQTHSLLDNMATTMANTIKWGVASGAMNKLSGSVQEAYYYIKDLDSSLNDIRIVTNKSSDDMAEFAAQANKAAKALGQSTTNYTDASLIYYQQGLSDEEVAARTEVTLKTANVTKQSTDDVSEELTAVWNGYKVNAQEAELYVDKLAAVAASTASNLEELSKGMSKVASAAAAMGVGEDQLAAQLSTIIAVTRQAPESVGTALKTIYARMTDIQAGVDEEGATLGTYSGQMAKMGVNVLDATGSLRDMGDVIEEIGEKWSTYSREQQVYLARTMAGTRQYNNLIALFDNWDQYTDTLKVAQDATGTLQEQQDIYMESTEAHLKRTKAEWEDLVDSFANADTVNVFSDLSSEVLHLTTSLVDGIGGGGNALLALGSIATQVFSKQIAQGLATTIQNFQKVRSNAEQLNAQFELLQQFKGIKINDEATNKLINMKQQIINLSSIATTEQQNEANEMIKATNELYNQRDAWEEKKRSTEEYIGLIRVEKDINIDLFDQENQPTETTIDQLKIYNEQIEREIEVNKKHKEEIKAVSNAMKNLSSANQELINIKKDSQSTDEQQTQAIENQKKALNELTLSIEDIEVNYDELNSIGRISSEEALKIAKRYHEAMQKYKEALVAGNENEIRNSAQNVANIYSKLIDQLISEGIIASNTIKGQINGNTETFENAIINAENEYRKFINNIALIQQIQQTIQLISSIGMLSSNILSLKNIWKTWNDESLSGSEKLLQTLSSLGMALPMIVANFGNLSTGVIKLATAMGMVTTGTVELKTALTFLGTSTVLGPLALITAAIVGITAAYNYFTVTEKEAKKAQEDLTKSIQESNSALQEYNKNLSLLSNNGVNANSELSKEFERLSEGVSKYGENISLSADEYKRYQEIVNQLVGISDSIVIGYNNEGQAIIDKTTALKDLIKYEQEERLQSMQFSGEKGDTEKELLKSANAVSKKKKESQEIDVDAAITARKQINKPENLVNQNIEEYANSLKNLTDLFHGAVSSADKFSNELNIINTIVGSNKLEDIKEINYQDFKNSLDKIEKDFKYQLRKGLISQDTYDEYIDNITKINESYSEEAFNNMQESISLSLEDNIKEMQLVYKNYANILERSFATESGAAWTKIQNMGFGSQFKQYLNNLKIDSEEGYKKAYEDIESNYTKFIDGLQSLELAKAGGIFDESQYDSYAEYIQGITKYLSDHPEVTSQVLDIAFGLTFEIKDDNIKIADKEIEDIKERIQKQINTSGEDINFDEVWEYLSNNFSSDEINKILEKGININWKDILASETSKNQATAVIKEILSQAVGTTVDETEITDADLEGLGATTKKKITELKEEISDYAKYLQEAAKESDKIDDSLENNATAAKKVAIANTRLNKGLEDLQKNFEGYKDSLQNSEKGTAEYAKALNELKDDMANVLNLSSGDVLSNDFFEGEQGVQNLKDIEAAANGDIEAIERLRKAASEDIVQQIIVNLNDQNAIDDLKSLTNTLENYAANNNLEIGARLDNASFIDSLNDIINATKMTAEQAGNYLKAMGYDAEVSYDETRVPSTMQMPSVRFAVKADENGTSIIAEPDFTEVEYEQVVRTPVVKALTYTGSAGGTVNYKNTAAGGATTNKSKKSGGGSGSKTKEPKKEKNVKDEIDRYHDINLELKDTSESLNRIQKAEKNLIGEELIDNLNKQLDILEKQKKIYEEKLKLEKEEAKEIQEALKTQGVLFADGDLGYITNYTAVLQAKLDYVNDIIAQYNAMSAEEQEGFKDTVDQAKEDYEDFKKQIESYDTLISDTIPGLEDDIQDAVDKQVEIQIKQFTMEVDVRLDMAEAERDFNKFRKKVIDKIEDDDILGNAKADLDDLLTYFDTNDTGIGPIQKLTDQVNDTLDQLEQLEDGGTADVYGKNRAQALEDLKKYYEELMNQLEDVQDLVDQIEDSYLDMIDEAIEKFDEQVDQYEYINDLLNHNLNVIGLLYGDDAYSKMTQYYQQIEANNNKELDFLKKRVQYAYDMMQAETDPDAKEKWQEEWEDALSTLNKKVEDSLQNIIDKYVNSINEVFDELNKKITDGLDLDYVKDEWDLINKNAEQYLDTINGAYEIQKLENKYIDALNDTDSLSAQKKLNDLMTEQLAMLQDKEKLTQYDVDRANQLYEIALKEIALEEAQQNKSTMRLRRDSQGNYTYQYVADEDSIAQAQQELLDAQNSLYNLDKDQYKQNLDDIYSIYSEFQQKLLALYQDQTLSAEDRAQKEAMYVEQYGELINGLVEQNEDIRTNLHGSAFDSLAEMYDVDVKNFTQMTDEEQDTLMNSLIPQWDSGIQHMTDTFAGEGGFIPTCSDAFDQLKEVTEDYQTSLDDLEQAAGVDFESMANGYDENIQKAQELLSANDDLINKYSEEIDAIKAVISQLDDLIIQYAAAQRAAEKATEAAYAYWQAAQDIDYDGEEELESGYSNRVYTTTVGSINKTVSASSSSNYSSSSGSSDVSKKTKNSKKNSDNDNNDNNWKTITLYSSSTTDIGHPLITMDTSQYNFTILNNREGKNHRYRIESNDGEITGYTDTLKWEEYKKYDTGGYTGEWGDSSGKLAVLHQKELVLNDTDTENFLSAIKIIRNMDSLLSSLNQSVLDRAFSLSSNIGTGFNGIESNSSNDTVEQNVHIEASFPNVSDSKEIENAFNNLVNRASQYAYNTQR